MWGQKRSRLFLSPHSFCSVHESSCIPANPRRLQQVQSRPVGPHGSSQLPSYRNPFLTWKPCKIPNSFVRGKHHLIRAHVPGSIWLGAAVRRLPELSWRPGGSARSWLAGARGQQHGCVLWQGADGQGRPRSAPLQTHAPSEISWSLYQSSSSALGPPASSKERELNMLMFPPEDPHALHPSHLCNDDVKLQQLTKHDANIF